MCRDVHYISTVQYIILCTVYIGQYSTLYYVHYISTVQYIILCTLYKDLFEVFLYEWLISVFINGVFFGH